MKRYLTFFGSYYYPKGGMDDFIGDFDTMDECKNKIDDKIKEEFDYENPFKDLDNYIKREWENNWATIYDTKERKEVWSK